MSKRPNWTPGPWREEGPDEFGDRNIMHPADALAVAAVVNNMRIADEVAANAKLIAAAPELYEALDRLLNWPGRFTGGERAMDVAFARAALARAKGEDLA